MKILASAMWVCQNELDGTKREICVRGITLQGTEIIKKSGSFVHWPLVTGSEDIAMEDGQSEMCR